jgi:hypothetical protein
MRGALAVLVAVSMVVPVRAFAAEELYPRVVHRPGRVCVQSLGEGGKIEETCRAEGADWKGTEGKKDVGTAREVQEVMDFRPDPPPPPPRRPVRGSDAAVALAQADAERDGAGEYFAGGFLGGCLLGVVGCAGVTGIVLASDPMPPRVGAFENPTDELIYRDTYRSEVKNRRALNAVIGGIVGTAVAAVIVYAVLTSAESQESN